MMGSKTSAIAAGVCGALFVGYCIYFDRKRRSDPNFKNRLRERRRKQRAAKEKAGLSRLPDLKDAEAVQKFFLEEIQLGEELLAQGDYEKGVDHLTNAIAVCGQPQQLLQVLQQTLPPPVFQMLLTKLPTISQVGHCRQLDSFCHEHKPVRTLKTSLECAGSSDYYLLNYAFLNMNCFSAKVHPNRIEMWDLNSAFCYIVYLLYLVFVSAGDSKGAW
uniref:Translocase of outer mitochondrial membrane 20b n=1 Tax=Scleropages formosus TaxID=113540 RepID=A0A8C9QP06_SCLFO